MVFAETQNALRWLGRPRCVLGHLCRIAAVTAAATTAVSAQAAPPKWALFALGGYSIACPAPPESPAGQKPADGFRQWVVAQGSSSFVFSLTRVVPQGATPLPPPEVLLRQCVNGLVSSSKGTILAERDLLLDGWIGVEIRYRTEAAAEVQLRAYSINDQIVNMIVTHPSGAVPPDGLSRYFDSIQLPSDVGKGKFLQPGPKIAKFDMESSGFSVKVPPGVRSEIVKGSETGSVEMHRFAAVYLNRVYMGFVVDPPPNAKLDLDNDATGKAAQAINSTIAGMLQQVPAKTGSRDTPLGKAWTMDFDAGHGLSGHAETYVRNNHTYSVLAVVPSSMMTVDEVKGFFDSVALPAKK